MECLLCTLRAQRPSLTRHLPKPSQQQQQQQRPASTARRLRVLHRVPPAPSFVPDPEIKQSHIIYNPPSSLPNIYHTPTKFLPASDPRRPAAATTTTTTSSAVAAAAALSPTAALAQSRARAAGPHPSTLPALDASRRSDDERKYHLTPADVAELRALRAADHRAWTVKKLAARFGCSEAFVRLCAYSVEAKAEEEERVGKITARWGRTKREGREEREKRREGWGRGS